MNDTICTNQPSKGTALIIPARNEALSLPAVLSRVPSVVTRVLVVDNGSTDDTAAVAKAFGAEVILEPVAGYGKACLAGIAALASSPPAFVAFADADGSDGVQNLETLLTPLFKGEVDLALAARQPVELRALTLQQRFGNRLATCLIRIIWGHDFRDLGPMRALSWEALTKLRMMDEDFGWTVEMQIKAVKLGLRIAEHPLPYYPRIAGRSKISRTLAGVVRAGTKILWVIGRELVPERFRTNGGSYLEAKPELELPRRATAAITPAATGARKMAPVTQADSCQLPKTV